MEDSDKTTLQSSTSSHRLATISASQALQKLSDPGGKWITTGLPKLNLDLRGSSFLSRPGITGGYPKGQITEIYGPPAAGKTALGLQAAIEALHQGSHVAWIDAARPLHTSRLATYFPPDSPNNYLLTNLHHYLAPTLPHLLSLICHPPPHFPHPSTTLLILDGASSLLTSTYPTINATQDFTPFRKMTPDALWLATRRSAVITELMSKLNRLAATRDIAVVLISQTSVKVRSEMGAVLRPAMWGRDWGEGVRNGVVVFRDFMPRGKGGENRGKGAVRFAAVVKVGGRERRRMQVVVPFVIEDGRCCEIDGDVAMSATKVVLPMVTKTLVERKRKREEVGDSQSEDGEDDLGVGIGRGADVGGAEAVVISGSDARAEANDPAMAQFEAAMEAGFDEI